MKEHGAGFFSLFGTLLGSGIFLVPSLAARAGSGGWLVPVTVLPLLAAVFLFLYHASLVRLPYTLMQCLRVAYAVLCAFLAACALCLASVLCRDLMLPGAEPVLLIAVSAGVLYLCIATEHTVCGLNIMFFACLAVITLMQLLSLTQGRTDRLSASLSEPLEAGLGMLPFFSGIMTVPALARRGVKKRSMLLALVLSCAVYALITAICIAVLGDKACAGESYAALTVLKSGTVLLNMRLFFASISFSLVMLKPAVNLGWAALVSAEEVIKSKWLRPGICAFVLAAALLMHGIIQSL